MLTPPSPRMVPTLPAHAGHVAVAEEDDRAVGAELERQAVHLGGHAGVAQGEERRLGVSASTGEGDPDAQGACVVAGVLVARLHDGQAAVAREMQRVDEVDRLRRVLLQRSLHGGDRDRPQQVFWAAPTSPPRAPRAARPRAPRGTAAVRSARRIQAAAPVGSAGPRKGRLTAGT